MRIFVKAKPGSFKEHVEKVDETHFIIAVREPPEKGLANLVIRKALADFLSISPSRITQLSGFASRNKVYAVE